MAIGSVAATAPADARELQAKVSESAAQLGVPGVAVGVFCDDAEQYAFHGVTSVENPLPVDAATLFSIGSTTKTFTATAIMRLVDQGLVDLGERVRTYVPELRVKDEAVARDVRVLNLLNHTAGWQGDFEVDTGAGDDALARYVEKMATLDQVSTLDGDPSYNNAALCVAGRVIEKVTGTTFEQAVSELLLQPLGLNDTFLFPNDVMTRRFAVGHIHDDGSDRVFRPWIHPRAIMPAGGMTSTAADQIAWARFHLGDGGAPDGTRILSERLLKQMQEVTSGVAPAERYGLAWMLRDVDGVRLVEHGGDGSGQHSAFSMAPERGFVITVLTNSGPNGQELREELVRWGLETYAGIVERDPDPVDLDPAALLPYTGTYATGAAFLHVTTSGARLLATVELRSEADEEAGQAPPPSHFGILPGSGDRFVFLEGPYKGMKGHFVRDGAGQVEAIHVGRLAPRVR